MENTNAVDAPLTLEARIELNGILTLIKGFLPNIASYYPMLVQQIDNAQKKADEYLGDNEKTVVASRINGKTKVIVFDNSKRFKIQRAPAKSVPRQEIQKQIDDLQALLASADPSTGLVTIPAVSAFEADKNAILVNEGVRSFIENKILGNSSIQFILENLKEEYEQKFAGQPAPALPSLSNLIPKQ